MAQSCQVLQDRAQERSFGVQDAAKRGLGMQRRQFMTGASLATATGLFRALGVDSALAATAPRSVTIAFPIDIPDWDPMVNTTPTTSTIVKCVFDAEMELTPDLKLIPNVVTGYRWLDTNGKTFQVDLRDDVTFHNGDKLTSTDLKFTLFDRIRADPTVLSGAPWRNVSGVETPTPTRAILHFDKPMALAPIEMAEFAACILPRDYYLKVGQNGFRKNPVGSGPYRLVDYQRNSRIVLEAYDRYWGGAAQIKRLTFQIVADPVARAAAVQSGQADITLNLPVREVERLGKLPGMAPYLTPTTSITFIQMVNKGVLQDRNVRLAAHHALNKPAISKALTRDHMVPVWLPAGPGMPGYVPGFKLAYDPDKAKALLAKSGYGPQKPVTFNFYATNGVFPSDFDIARAVVQMWKRVGIEANLRIFPPAEIYAYQRSNRFDGPVLKPWNPAAGDPFSYSGFMLDPTRVYSVWRSQDIPPKLYPLLQEVDPDKRIAGFKAFDQWQVSQGYSIPMFQGLATVVARKNLNYRPFRSGYLRPYTWS
jgi:peptide/nickel transport system substrate-binding protein